MKNVAYEVPADLNSLPVKMVLPVYKTDPEYCLLQPYKIELLDDSTASTKLPGFITFDKINVTILNKDPAVTGKFVFRFVATEPRFGLVDRAVTFSVTITCRVGKIVTGASDVSDIVYVLRTAPFTFKIPNYSHEPTACATVLSYKLENASAGGSADSLPKFVQYDAKKMTVTLNGDNFDDSGKEFKLRMIVTTPDQSVKNTNFQVTISTFFKNDPP